MIGTFLAGCLIGLAAFVYHGPVYRYRNLQPHLEDGRLDHAKRSLQGLAWRRVAVFILASGLLSVVLWHGLSDLITAVCGGSHDPGGIPPLQVLA